jgi:putative FmdB family regulatory protein
MPIYEYVCGSCHHKFEKMRPFSQANEGAECPRCKKQADRVLSACYSMSTSEGGVPQPVSGTGGGCSSCSGGSCSTCGS